MLTMKLSRRQLISGTAAFAGVGLSSRLIATQEPGLLPHFFIHIVVLPGADSLYSFDARPLSFKAAGKVANFAAEDPFHWQGRNGGQCLAAPYAKALLPYKDRLAIINGIHMTPGFEGHIENERVLYSANPFSGNYFAPLLTRTQTPLAFLGLGSSFDFSVSNKERSLILDHSLVNLLAAKAALIQSQNLVSSPARAWVASRNAACAEGAGMFAEGCRSYQKGMEEARPLSTKLAKAQVSYGSDDSKLLKGVRVALKYFMESIADVALLVDSSHDFDTHAASNAAASPMTFTTFMADIAAVLKLLIETPFDAARGLSMLDVTTVMINSEFSRTNRQLGLPIEESGTDHNPQGNMALLAGKGIRGDLVVGATDLDALDQNGEFAKVSALHRRLDGDLLKRMGKPYDFTRGETSEDNPEVYSLDNYISMASVINTVLAGFAVAQSAWLKNNVSSQGSSMQPAQLLTRVLQS